MNTPRYLQPDATRCQFDSIKLATLKTLTLDAALISVLSLVLAAFLMQLWRADFSVPFQYLIDDGPFQWLDFDANLYFAQARSIEQGGWIDTMPRMAAPNGLDGHLYPQFYFEQAMCAFFWIAVQINLSWGQVVNLFYLLSYPAIATLGYLSWRWLGFGRTAAIAVGLIGSFLPYRYMTGQMHMAQAAYWALPACVALSVRIANRDPWRRPTTLAAVLVAILLATSDMYFAIFGVFLFLGAGLLAALDAPSEKRLAACGPALFSATTTILILLVLLSPVLRDYHSAVAESSAKLRQWEHAEFWGLKIVHLLLPVRGHRISAFDRLAEEHNVYPFTHVNESIALGVIGSIGFLVLLLALLNRKSRSDTVLGDSRTQAAAGLCILTLLYATVGGFGALFSFLVAPQIRSLFHIGPFIAYLAYIPLAVWVDRRSAAVGAAWPYLVAALALIAIADQCGFLVQPNYQATQKAYNIDHEYFTKVEAALPRGARVLQLPYVPFPEGGSMGRIRMYEQFVPLLHTESLRFSFGSFNGSEQAEENKQIPALPVDRLLIEACLAGWHAMLIDRRGWDKQLLPADLNSLVKNRDTDAIKGGQDGRYVTLLTCAN